MPEARIGETIAAVGRDALNRIISREIASFDILPAADQADLPGLWWRYVMVEAGGRLVAAAPGGGRITKSSSPLRQRRWAFGLLCGAMPVLTVGCQVAAQEAARALSDRPLDLNGERSAAKPPWFQALVVIDVVSIFASVLVLAAFQLSPAFIELAVGCVFVFAVSGTMFGEPAEPAQIINAGAILVGIWLNGRGEGARC